MLHIYEEDLCKICYQTDIDYCGRHCLVQQACNQYKDENGQAPENKIRKNQYNGNSQFKVWNNY